MNRLNKKSTAVKKAFKGKAASATVRKPKAALISGSTTLKKVLEKRAGKFIKQQVTSLKDRKSTSYQAYLLNSLKDPEEAAGYLNAALVGGDIKVLLMAIQNVVQAQGGIASLSQKTNKSRTSLYKSLSEKGNPYLKNTNELLNAMGMHLAIVPDKQWASMTQRLDR